MGPRCINLVGQSADQAASGTLWVVAFIMEQSAARTSDPIQHIASVDDIEQRSGLEFFRELSATAQNTLEANPNTTWVQSW